MSKKNQNYTNRKQNRFQPERMRGNVFVNNSGKQWLPGENGRAAKVEMLLREKKEEKKAAGRMAGYKDSGVEWIGEIPEEWEIHPLRMYLNERKNKNNNGTEKNLLSLSYGHIIRKDINTQKGLLPLSFNTYNIVEPSDIIIRPTDLQNDKKSLRVGYAAERGIITSAYFDLYSRNNAIFNTKFGYYLLSGYDAFKIFYGLGNGVRQSVTFKEFASLPAILPPLPEQQRIADFLDTKCGILDRTIDAVSRQIEDLEKYKKALITKTVTKGICKKGEPERKMKESGVEWIGEDIPFDWDINRLQFCIDEISERNYAGKETHILSLMKDKGVIPYEEKGRVGNISKTDLTQYKLAYPNTLITNSMNIIIGSSGISQYKGCVSPAYYVFKAKPNSDIRYFNYIFAVRAFQNECRRFANGILEIRLRISSTNLLKIKVPVPPLAEQQQIADYLDEKCKNIDTRIQKRREQLEWLKEYKKSLIFDYVTGKKRV